MAGRIRAIRQAVLDRLGVAINRAENLYPWQVAPVLTPSHTRAPLPPGADAYLRSDNPALVDLQRRYAAFDPAVTTPAVWGPDAVDAHDLCYFRGDNAYVFQLRSRTGNELSYALTYYHAVAGAQRAILEACVEDELFGIHSWRFEDRIVSRDLLDSVGEIAFLQCHVGLDAATTLLDIGAGYGRLAHRVTEATAAAVVATDAFPASTFLSDYYLRFRGSRATVAPLDRVEAVLRDGGVTVATNIHSFSECRPEAIHWWVSRLVRAGVRHLMVIPNARDADGRCLTNDGADMDAMIRTHGYAHVVTEPRYDDPVVQRWGVNGCLISLYALR